jgi:AhpD family alkylhydroperoxidase
METQVMNQRFKMGKIQPKAYEALDPLDNYVENASIPGVFKEFIRIRASQINSCAYCVNMHTRDARKLGVADEKIVLISVWREARNIFSEEEQLILEMTEEITLIHRHGLSDNLYQRSLDAFGETGTAEIIMAIISINAWNRIGVGLKMEPQL